MCQLSVLLKSRHSENQEWRQSERCCDHHWLGAWFSSIVIDIVVAVVGSGHQQVRMKTDASTTHQSLCHCHAAHVAINILPQLFTRMPPNLSSPFHFTPLRGHSENVTRRGWRLLRGEDAQIFHFFEEGIQICQSSEGDTQILPYTNYKNPPLK